MDREELVLKIYLDEMRRREQIISRLDEILMKIKEISLKHDESCNVLVFGSVVRGEMRPDSDIDIMIISKYADDHYYRMELLTEIYKEVGGEGILEIHIVTPKEFNIWYRKFSNGKYKEI